MRILVVEDEEKVARALASGLEAEHFRVTVVKSGEEGFFLASSETFDLVLLDLTLPGCDGLEMLESLRRHGHRMPVLVLTARDAVEDRVLGLDAGADDYVLKPFAFSELFARIRALLRRGRGDEALRLKAGDLVVDVVTRKVTRAGHELTLTGREFELLEYLLRHKGHAVPREMLARDVWQEPNPQSAIDNVIDVTVARLRRRVDDPFEEKLIQTIRGVGFTIEDEGSRGGAG